MRTQHTPMLSKAAIIWIAVLGGVTLISLIIVAVVLVRYVWHSDKRFMSKAKATRNSVIAWKKPGSPRSARESYPPPVAFVRRVWHEDNTGFERGVDRDDCTRQMAVAVPPQNLPSRVDGSSPARSDSVWSPAAPCSAVGHRQGDEWPESPTRLTLPRMSRYYAGWPKLQGNSLLRKSQIGRAL